VGEDAGSLGPKPFDDKVLVIARRKIDEPVDPEAPAALDAPHGNRLGQQLRRVARVCGLLGREVAFLGCGDGVEAVPVGLGGGLEALTQE
jgi:hypothetical protein